MAHLSSTISPPYPAPLSSGRSTQPHVGAFSTGTTGIQRDWVWRGWQTRYAFLPVQGVAHFAGSFEHYAGSFEPVTANCAPAPVPMLLLHGFGASIPHWRHNMPAFSQHHPVYALDLVGFGASEKPGTTYNADVWVEQVYEFWQMFIREPVVLVGNSIGSLVSMAVAAIHPDMVRGVVMLNLPDSSVMEEFFPPVVRPLLSIAGRLLHPLLAATKVLLTQPVLFNPVFWLVRRPTIVRAWAQQAYSDRSRVTDELVTILTQPAYDRGADRALRAMIASPSGQVTAKAVLPTLQVPLLLIWGKQDQMVPPTLAPLFAKLNPAMTVVQLDGAGHCPHDETPERVNPLILQWIASWQSDH